MALAHHLCCIAVWSIPHSAAAQLAGEARGHFTHSPASRADGGGGQDTMPHPRALTGQRALDGWEEPVWLSRNMDTKSWNDERTSATNPTTTLPYKSIKFTCPCDAKTRCSASPLTQWTLHCKSGPALQECKAIKNWERVVSRDWTNVHRCENDMNVKNTGKILMLSLKW